MSLCTRHCAYFMCLATKCTVVWSFRRVLKNGQFKCSYLRREFTVY